MAYVEADQNGDELAALLLTGATGFVGGALLVALTADSRVRCLVRDGSSLQPSGKYDSVEADLLDRESLCPALEGVDEVYYLVHSMEPGADGEFADRDRIAAENFVEVAAEAGVGRTIYLGGLQGSSEESEHLASRNEVEEILGQAPGDLVSLRASMIVGAGSGSFRTVVQLVEKLPVLAFPDWSSSRSQPVAIADVVAALVAARDVAPGSYEIAGPDTLTFEQITEIVAGLLGETHRSFHLPFSSSKAEATIAAAVADADRELLEPLMAGLHADLLVERNALLDVFGVDPTPFSEAASRAIGEMRDAAAA